MPRLKLTIAYDGRPWKGWQTQAGRATVQDNMEAAFQKLVGFRVVVQGSGRTDAGVHARAQIAHADVGDLTWPMDAWVRALNMNLPTSIRVLSCEVADSEFHARFDARGKVYEYRVWRESVSSPFEVGLSWHRHGEIKLEALHAGARILEGTHNFARLSANRGDISDEQRRANAKGLTRTIHSIEVYDEWPILRLVFHGSGFLYKMVRLMAGSMVQVGRGRADLAWLQDLVSDPSGPKSNFCAPADGLYLVRVFYPDEPTP